MTSLTWNREKPSGSRVRIIGLLRKGRKTIDELAGSLGVTTNAVRAQIGLLEREGIVEVQGEVKGTRRPAAVYGIRTGADVQFSKAYPIVLSQLIRSLAGRMTRKQMEDIMRAVGEGIAGTMPLPTGNARERVAGAVRFLASLGTAADVSEERGKSVITGHGCLISRAVEADVSSCKAMESLLASLTGLPVKEHCDHGAQPGCRFEITMRPEKGKMDAS